MIMLKQLSSIDSYEIVKTTPLAFTGGTENTRGDSAGTLAAYALYGDIWIDATPAETNPFYYVCMWYPLTSGSKVEVNDETYA